MTKVDNSSLQRVELFELWSCCTFCFCELKLIDVFYSSLGLLLFDFLGSALLHSPLQVPDRQTRKRNQPNIGSIATILAAIYSVRLFRAANGSRFEFSTR